MAERGGHIRALGVAWRGHVRGRRKSERNKGYAVEAARAAIDWSFATFELDSIIHCIDRENTASQAVARRLGAEKQGETDLFGHLSDVWVTKRSSWRA